MALRFAYNTNGTASHRLEDALSLMAESGYAGVALTLDFQHFDPFASDWEAAAGHLRARLDGIGFGSVIETGARYLLDPRAKHEPTLVTADPDGRRRRVAFLRRGIEIGAILGSEAVSFWAGVPKPGVDRSEAQSWLRDGLAEVAEIAKGAGVTAALEPEPGMLVETVDDYAALARDIPDLTLALDLGHCLVTGERDPAAAAREFAGRIGTVSIEDMKRGEHVHLAFGEGDMDIPGILDALEEIRFDRLVCVELSRESHRADTMIPAAIRYLRECRG
ncbi:MAG: sugar phosphate isomerase/epimerase [Methylobacteriaceae bacterium]|nr:sugar phosphate isomerase/epimerase [Methylobacteriaceae bacterium]